MTVVAFAPRLSPLRVTLVGVTAAILVLFAVELAYGWTNLGWRFAWGNDLAIYTDATRRLFSDGSWYLDRQLHGPYPLGYGDVLYPPVTALAFAPFLVLPFIVWLAVPMIVVAWLIRAWRPALWAWPLIALCVAWPMTPLKAIAGNPSTYVAMLTGLGLRYGWPAALILLKPSLGPFALIGIRDRRWWAVVSALAVLSLPWIGLTLEWPVVALNAQGGGLGYSLVDLPMVLIPVIAWWARRSGPPRRTGRWLLRVNVPERDGEVPVVPTPAKAPPPDDEDHPFG